MSAVRAFVIQETIYPKFVHMDSNSKARSRRSGAAVAEFALDTRGGEGAERGTHMSIELAATGCMEDTTGGRKKTLIQTEHSLSRNSYLMCR